MKKLEDDDPGVAHLEQLIAEITIDAYGDDEQLWAFQQAFEDSISVPCDGFVIGEQALGLNFGGLLPWGYIHNRPFLRCLHGFGLCLWRLGRFEEAGRVFERMLRLNAADEMGVRFMIAEVRTKTAWEDSREEKDAS
jgi:hypothetical protein